MGSTKSFHSGGSKDLSSEDIKEENGSKDAIASSSTSMDILPSDDLSALEKNVPPKATAEETAEEQPEPTAKLTRITYLAFAAMCVVDLTEALDATSIAVVLPVSHLPYSSSARAVT